MLIVKCILNGINVCHPDRSRRALLQTPFDCAQGDKHEIGDNRKTTKQPDSARRGR
jgi:hypothetical protein